MKETSKKFLLEARSSNPSNHKTLECRNPEAHSYVQVSLVSRDAAMLDIIEPGAETMMETSKKFLIEACSRNPNNIKTLKCDNPETHSCVQVSPDSRDAAMLDIVDPGADTTTEPSKKLLFRSVTSRILKTLKRSSFIY